MPHVREKQNFLQVREKSGNFVMSCQGIVGEFCDNIIFRLKLPSYDNRVSTASGNQRKLEGILPVREKSGNFAIFEKIREKSGNFDHQIFFIYFILFSRACC